MVACANCRKIYWSLAGKREPELLLELRTKLAEDLRTPMASRSANPFARTLHHGEKRCSN